MKIRFSAFGHQNIKSTHRTTLELTEETHLSKKGDCIIGISARIPDLAPFLAKNRVIVTLKAGEIFEVVHAIPNPFYINGKELVIRKGDFSSQRTFAIRADKAALDLSRRLVGLMKNPRQRLVVEISNEEEATK